MQEDLQHLRTLGIFHYVVGSIAVIFACFPLIHLAFGIALMSGTLGADTGGPEGTIVGGFMVAFASLFILFGLAMAGVVIAAGRFLRSQKHYIYCLVVGAVECIFFPFGTVLGVFTVIVLQRPSVKELFASNDGTVSQT